MVLVIVSPLTLSPTPSFGDMAGLGQGFDRGIGTWSRETVLFFLNFDHHGNKTIGLSYGISRIHVAHVTCPRKNRNDLNLGLKKISLQRQRENERAVSGNIT